MGTSPQPQAIIVGGGIAGMSTALALSQRGVPATVLEAREGPGDRGDGLFLNMASNGMEALARLGVVDSVLAHGSPCHSLVMMTGGGRVLGRVSNESPHSALGSVLLRRHHVTDALTDAVRAAGICVRYRAGYESMEKDGDRIVVRTTDGTEFTGSVVLGCDGIHSRVRTHLVPAAPSPAYTGLICVGGLARTPGLPDTPGTLNLVFGHEAFFGYLTDAGRTYWFSNIADPRQPAPGEMESRDEPTWLAQLARLHARDCDPIPAVIAAAQETVVGYALFDMPRVSPWHSGRACLLGDAAHATSPHAGQGASMALEDAVTVAACLQRFPDPTAAFEDFEQRRRRRVDRIVRFSRRMGDNKALTNPAALAVRDTLMSLALKYLATARRRAWIYDSPLSDHALEPA